MESHEWKLTGEQEQSWSVQNLRVATEWLLWLHKGH